MNLRKKYLKLIKQLDEQYCIYCDVYYCIPCKDCGYCWLSESDIDYCEENGFIY